MAGGKTCTCGSPLGAKNVSGLCRPCVARRNNANPTIRAKQREGILAQTGRDIERKRRVLAENAAKARQCPEYRARMAERMRTLVQPLSQKPEVRAKADYAARGRKISEHRLGWCPPEYREQYLKLVRWRWANAKEARRIILEQIAHDRRNETFEDKLARVASGKASLVPNVRRLHLEPTVRP